MNILKRGRDEDDDVNQQKIQRIDDYYELILLKDYEQSLNYPSTTIEILDKLLYKSLNEKNDSNDQMILYEENANVNTNIKSDVFTVKKFTEKYENLCGNLVEQFQTVFKNPDYKSVKEVYNEYKKMKNVPKIKQNGTIYTSQLNDTNNAYDKALEIQFDNIISNMQRDKDQDINETILTKFMFTCLNKNKENRKIILHNDSNGNKNEFLTRFLNKINPVVEENESNTQDSQQTPAYPISTSSSEVEVPAGNTYVQNGIDLNFMMQERFSSRIKGSLNIFDNFDNFKNNIIPKIQQGNTVDLQEQLTNVYDEVKTIYKQTKFYIDAGDIIHDVNKKPTNKTSENYYDGLILLGKKNLGLEEVDIKNNLDRCFANTTQSDYVNVNQEKTRKMRNDASSFLQNEIGKTGQNNKLLIPNIETRLLGQREGYFELIKQIYSIWGDGEIKPFVYKESGRALQINDILKYYGTLNNDDQTEFISECMKYCDFNDDDDKKIKGLFTLNPNIQVELLPITSFDGCGASSQIKNKDIIKPYIFNNVFGYFNYTVYTVYNMGAFYHLVIVKNQDNEQYQTVQAIFGFNGNITINMLLKSVGIQLSRQGEGGKGSLISISTVYNILTTKGFNLRETYPEINFAIDASSYYAPSINNIGLQQLLLLGNKTIGDLIFTTYKDVYSVSTVDSLIADSTMYYFLSGNTEILQSVWMQTGGKGWKYTPGLFKEDINTKATFISIQLLSSLMFLKTFSMFTDTKSISSKKLSTVMEEDYYPETYNDSQDSEDTQGTPENNIKSQIEEVIINYNGIIQSITEINCSNIEPLERFYSILNYILVDFDNIKNYTSADNIYNACMVQLLIYENYNMKQRIFDYIEKLISYISNYTENNETSFLNNIYTLPKIDTLFLSNISTLASNNSESYPLFELMNLSPPVPNENIIIDINNTYIDISYNSTIIPKDQSFFIKQGFSDTEIKYDSTTVTRGSPSTYNIKIKLPYTIESLINLYLTNKLEDADKLDIKNRLVSFFKDSIDSVQINNTEITGAIYDNLNALLKSVNILDENDTLQNIDSVDFNNDDDDNECGCENDACSINNTTTNTAKNEGGTRKNKRKQHKKYKSYNRKTNYKNKTNRKSKSKKHNKSKNERKSNKTQRKHR